MKTSLTTRLNLAHKKSVCVLTRSFAMWNKMLLIEEFGSQLLLNDSRLNSIHVSAVIPDLHKGDRSYFRELGVIELLFDKKETSSVHRSNTLMAFCS